MVMYGRTGGGERGRRRRGTIESCPVGSREESSPFLCIVD